MNCELPFFFPFDLDILCGLQRTIGGGAGFKLFVICKTKGEAAHFLHCGNCGICSFIHFSLLRFVVSHCLIIPFQFHSIRLFVPFSCMHRANPVPYPTLSIPPCPTLFSQHIHRTSCERIIKSRCDLAKNIVLSYRILTSLLLPALAMPDIAWSGALHHPY